MINFSIGGFYLKSNELFYIIEALKKANNKWLIDLYQIKSVFGSFPNAIWSGGRTTVGYPWSYEKIKRTIKYYNSQNIGLRYTFTNSLIGKAHLSDYYCNMLLELAHNELNGVILNSSVLFEYIKKNYPKYSFISSITKSIESINEIVECQNDYNLVVPSVSLIQKYGHRLFDVIDNSKVEILVNEVCLVSNCPFKKEHYEIESLRNMNLDPNLKPDFCSSKFSKKQIFNNHEVHINPEELIKLYKDYQINNFKFSGRAQPSGRFFEEFGRFLIKKEYLSEYFKNVLYFFDIKDSINAYECEIVFPTF